MGAGLALKPPHKDGDCTKLSGGVLEGLFVTTGRPHELSGALQCHALESLGCAELGAGAEAAGFAVAPWTG